MTADDTTPATRRDIPAATQRANRIELWKQEVREAWAVTDEGLGPDADTVLDCLIADLTADAVADAPEVEYREELEGRRWVRITRHGVVVVEGYLEGAIIPAAIEAAKRDAVAAVLDDLREWIKIPDDVQEWENDETGDVLRTPVIAVLRIEAFIARHASTGQEGT